MLHVVLANKHGSVQVDLVHLSKGIAHILRQIEFIIILLILVLVSASGQHTSLLNVEDFGAGEILWVMNPLLLLLDPASLPLLLLNRVDAPLLLRQLRVLRSRKWRAKKRLGQLNLRLPSQNRTNLTIRNFLYGVASELMIFIILVRVKIVVLDFNGVTEERALHAVHVLVAVLGLDLE